MLTPEIETAIPSKYRKGPIAKPLPYFQPAEVTEEFVKNMDELSCCIFVGTALGANVRTNGDGGLIVGHVVSVRRGPMIFREKRTSPINKEEFIDYCRQKINYMTNDIKEMAIICYSVIKEKQKQQRSQGFYFNMGNGSFSFSSGGWGTA